MSNAIKELTSLGQSIWYVNIQRRLLVIGEMESMIVRGEIQGVTSNPSIFNNSIANTNDYDSAISPLAWAGWKSEDIFWQLAIEDIQAAADLFMPLYKQTRGGDGYVSLEVSPKLANDSSETIRQAQDLWVKVNRPNLMVKIPATKEGIPAIQKAIAAGVNVNVTLIFSIDRYKEVIDAYLRGLEERIANGQSIDHVSSVASFFVSRVDTKIDQRLDAIIRSEGDKADIASRLLGKAGIANAKLAYEAFRFEFNNERFERLRTAGAGLQRPLWASTSTKSPAYPDTMYVDGLIGKHTVNTVPPQTLDAYIDHGAAAPTLTEGLDEAHRSLEELSLLGISMEEVTQELELEGVKAFADAFDDLLETLEERRRAEVENLGPLAGTVAKKIETLEAENFQLRFHAHDPELWTNDPSAKDEILNRLGWLTLPEESLGSVDKFTSFAREVLDDGITHFLLLGMGGSSLAPEVLSKVFEKHISRKNDFSTASFAILDSTDPGQIASTARKFPVEHTIYIVASKSGGTSEVQALMEYFWERARKTVGNKAGKHFVAITDPGTILESQAIERGFRKIFLAEPSVGGRYSALTAFGLVPAALMGIDIKRLLASARQFSLQCSVNVPMARNPGFALGTVLGCGALEGYDKLTFVIDPPFETFGTWLEQLVAESTGKQGMGIIPIEGESLAGLEDYSRDRLFVYIRQSGEYDRIVTTLERSGHPVVVIAVANSYDLGAEFYRWEVATSVACSILNVNAFNQPDVQDSKERTKNKIAEYRERGGFQEENPVWEDEWAKIYTHYPIKGIDLVEIIQNILHQGSEGEYIALNAYLPRKDRTDAALQQFRDIIRSSTGLATTIGYGPRYLHSTGQLHKGGPNTGIFILITADSAADINVPGQGISFGLLEYAQALGEYESLVSRHRRVYRIHLASSDMIKRLVKKLKVLEFKV